MNRKKANDYSKELDSLNKKIKSIDSKVRERLLALAIEYPDAVVGWVNDTDGGFTIKAKHTITETHINRISIDDCINYLAEIESWLELQFPHKQLEIDFPK